MARKSISVTIDESNLLWLRGRGYGRGNLSAALNDLITAARAGQLGAPPPVRSVVGTIDLAADDPALERADDVVRDLFARSLSRPLMVREPRAGDRQASRARRTTRRG
jgi:hypothetical protein